VKHSLLCETLSASCPKSKRVFEVVVLPLHLQVRRIIGKEVQSFSFYSFNSTFSFFLSVYLLVDYMNSSSEELSGKIITSF
jgi:hypothetical protein